MNWNHFIGFAVVAVICWVMGSLRALLDTKSPSKGASWAYCSGIVVYCAFIIGFWISLKRPPLRTMGETRLWYSLFMALSGMLTYRIWKYRWILSFSTLMASVFICINLLKPEIHSQSLMPALQSPWFIPHVTLYMFSYALFACTFLLVVGSWIWPSLEIENALHNLCTTGLAFFTIGMLLGAIWAKEAWGSFWSWDPKETWAAITWITFLIYLLLNDAAEDETSFAKKRKQLRLLLVLGFLFLQICWYGINYLPNAAGSIHNYA